MGEGVLVLVLVLVGLAVERVAVGISEVGVARATDVLRGAAGLIVDRIRLLAIWSGRSLTTTMPAIFGWIEQVWKNRPVSVNVKLNEAPNGRVSPFETTVRPGQYARRKQPLSTNEPVRKPIAISPHHSGSQHHPQLSRSETLTENREGPFYGDIGCKCGGWFLD